MNLSIIFFKIFTYIFYFSYWTSVLIYCNKILILRIKKAVYYTVFPFLITFIIVVSLENINFIPLVYIINFLVLFISLLISFKNSIDYIYGISINNFSCYSIQRNYNRYYSNGKLYKYLSNS